jgi:hypothetical protein
MNAKEIFFPRRATLIKSFLGFSLSDLRRDSQLSSAAVTAGCGFYEDLGFLPIMYRRGSSSDIAVMESYISGLKTERA